MCLSNIVHSRRGRGKRIGFWAGHKRRNGFMVKIDPQVIRQNLKSGIEKSHEALVVASNRCLENPTKLNKQKCAQIRKRYNALVEANELNDDELIQEALAGSLF